MIITDMKKKIMIEVVVPSGTTHHKVLINIDGDTCIVWFKLVGGCVYIWDGILHSWIPAYNAECLEMDESIKPIDLKYIELIEIKRMEDK